jgi:hypothetical protein
MDHWMSSHVLVAFQQVKLGHQVHLVDVNPSDGATLLSPFLDIHSLNKNRTNQSTSPCFYYYHLFKNAHYLLSLLLAETLGEIAIATTCSYLSILKQNDIC